nr:hypothetical protein CFP56_66989 [Quercus suber]
MFTNSLQLALAESILKGIDGWLFSSSLTKRHQNKDKRLDQCGNAVRPRTPHVTVANAQQILARLRKRKDVAWQTYGNVSAHDNGERSYKHQQSPDARSRHALSPRSSSRVRDMRWHQYQDRQGSSRTYSRVKVSRSTKRWVLHLSSDRSFIASSSEHYNMANPKETRDAKSTSDPALLDTAVSKPRWDGFWNEYVDPKRGDLLLLACCFVTGLLDCSTFRNWAAFVSMQTGKTRLGALKLRTVDFELTGNTIILCLSTAGLPVGQPWAWAATLISLVSFFAGAFVCTRICNILGATRRIVLASNILCQALLIILPAALATSSILISNRNHDVSEVLHDPRILIAIAPLAFQSGATIATSRLLGFGNEIPVTVYTSTYAALAADPKLFHLHGNTPRNRRLAAVVCVFAGAFVATWVEKKSAGIIVTLWASAGIKLILAGIVAFVFPRAEIV